MAMVVRGKCWECGSELEDGRGHRPSCAELARQSDILRCRECGAIADDLHRPTCTSWRPPVQSLFDNKPRGGTIPHVLTEDPKPSEPPADLAARLRIVAGLKFGDRRPAWLPDNGWGPVVSKMCQEAADRIDPPPAELGAQRLRALAAFRAEWIKWEIRRFDDATLSVVRRSIVMGPANMSGMLSSPELYNFETAKLHEQLEAGSCGHKSTAEAEHELANQRELASLKAAFEAARAP